MIAGAGAMRTAPSEGQTKFSGWQLGEASSEHRVPHMAPKWVDI